MPFVKLSEDYQSPPPPLKTWYFYNSSAQIDDPMFSIPTPGGPTTAAAALTSEAFASLGTSSNSSSAAASAAVAAATTAASLTNKSKPDRDDAIIAAATAASKIATTVGKGPASSNDSSSIAGSIVDNTPNSFATLSRTNSLSDLELSESAVASLEATPLIAPSYGPNNLIDSSNNSSRHPSISFSLDEVLENTSKSSLDDTNSNSGSKLDHPSHLTKNKQPRIENSADPDQLSTPPTSKDSTDSSNKSEPEEQKEAAFQTERAFYASISFSGAIAPTSTEWTAFNPNDNLDIENAYTKFQSKLKNAHDKARIMNHERHSDSHKQRHRRHKSRHTKEPKCTFDETELEVLVGIRRVYKVDVRDLLIKPVYWAPVKDISTVVRCSWFFSSTLTPTEPSMEAAVQKAFLKVRPWTSQYLDELKTALEVPDTFDKIKVPIKYTLTPEKSDLPPVEYEAVVVFAPCTNQSETEKPATEKESEAVDPLTSSDADDTEKVQPPSSEPQTTSPSFEKAQKPYPIAYIFPATIGNIRNPLSYLTSTTVYQLVTCLLAGRAPPGTITTLQQHFDFEEYKKIRSLPDRPSDILGFTPPKITDIIFVIHGIGQKLSERLESFSFTFAINRFNILVTEQLDSPAVKQYLGSDTTILALPINWRKSLDFEAIKNASQDQDTGKVLFSLAQITMKSIPAIRNIVSDVILDIPYYMSHYKGLLMESTINEANRIYKLFLKNNPGFDDYGKVHIIGHSLGSVLALDILSTQPTDIATARAEKLREIELKKQRKQELEKSGKGVKAKSDNEDDDIEEYFSKNFCFNTSNVFFVGSPAGFFLLLENSSLIPRKLYEKEIYDARMERYHKAKSTMEQRQEKLLLDDPSDQFSNRPDSAGTTSSLSTLEPSSKNLFAHSYPSQPSNFYPYGCMSIDRIYNVLHYSDPIGFCLNATVDPDYAENVELAALPTEKAFPILEKSPNAGKGSGFSFSFGSGSDPSSMKNDKGDTIGDDQRPGSFFESWKVKFPDIFSSNSPKNASTPTDSDNPKYAVSMPVSPTPEKEEFAKEDDQETVMGSTASGHGLSPSSSMVMEHDSTSEDEAGVDRQEFSTWSGKYFMSKILGSTRRKRSESQSSVSSAASVRSSFSIQSSSSAKMKRNTTETVSTLSASVSVSSEYYSESESTESINDENKMDGHSNVPDDGNRIRQKRLSSEKRKSVVAKNKGLLDSAFAPRASSMPPDLTGSRREKRPERRSHLNELFSSSGSQGQQTCIEAADLERNLDDQDNQQKTVSGDETDDNKSKREQEEPKDPFANMTYAEKKMHLLNDNGQIDYIIPLVGTLENQYLAMIKAHATYWDTKDFARLVAIECGRRENGPDKALSQFRVKMKDQNKEDSA